MRFTKELPLIFVTQHSHLWESTKKLPYKGFKLNKLEKVKVNPKLKEKKIIKNIL